MKKFLIAGVAFSGNKGASGMTTALIQNLRQLEPDARFIVLSYYPESDRRQALPEAVGECEISDFSPRAVVKRFFPACYVGVARALHLPKTWRNFGIFRVLGDREAVFLDASGISFVDGREKFLIFNFLTLFPALAAGTKIVKVAQAMGPFEHWINRWCAKLILPHLACIVARGAKTADYLAELNLKKVELLRFSDVAFSMMTTGADAETAQHLLQTLARPVIGISPSQVVWKLCRERNIDYLGILQQVAEKLLASGVSCVIFPHSARENTDKTHNNDLPLLREFHRRMPERRENLLWVEQELDAGVLRELIGQMDLLIASRFHAIISAMATGVPVVVIGWSHKYEEVLAPFQLAEFVLGYDQLSVDAVLERVQRIRSRRAELSEAILQQCAAIRKENERFFKMLLQA